MNKRSISIIALIIFLGVAACSPLQTNAEPTHIKAVVLPYTSFGPFFIAMDEGFFSDYNLDVEFVRMDSGTSPLALLEHGDIDVLGSGPNIALFNALAGGSEIRVVSDKGYLAADGCTYMALLAPKDWVDENQSLTAEALMNKRVSIDSINFEAFMFDKLLKDVGLGLEDLRLEDLAPPALTEALANGGVDIVSVGDPWITRIINSGEAEIWKSYQEIMPDMQFGFVLFGGNLRNENPEAAARFLAALLKGVDQYNEGKTARNIEILAKYTQLDEATLSEACWPPMNPTGELNIDSINLFQKWAVNEGLQDAFIPENDYWDPSILEMAQKLNK